MLTATFLINKTPSPILHRKTHFSLLYNAAMDYKYLRLIRYLCVVSTLTSHKSKFHPRAKPRGFVDYTFGVKVYRLYDILSKSFFIFRDHVFHEHLFSFHSIQHPNDSIDLFLNIVLPKLAQDIYSPFNTIHGVLNTSVNNVDGQSLNNPLQSTSNSSYH